MSATDQPLLATEQYNSHTAGHHQVHGYVYSLSAWNKADQIPSLGLFDRSRDGVIDEHHATSLSEAAAQGLLDSTLWIEYLGVPLPW